jgi:hypothetical protein
MAKALLRFPLLLLPLAACATAEDIGGTTENTSGFEPPDIAGTYTVTWDAPGCALPGDWVAGDLLISGEAADLSWDFGEAVLSGSVDGTFAYQLGGEPTVDGIALSVDGSGTAYLDASQSWALDGDLTLSAADSDPCEGPFNAQVPP